MPIHSYPNPPVFGTAKLMPTKTFQMTYALQEVEWYYYTSVGLLKPTRWLIVKEGQHRIRCQTNGWNSQTSCCEILKLCYGIHVFLYKISQTQWLNFLLSRRCCPEYHFAVFRSKDGLNYKINSFTLVRLFAHINTSEVHRSKSFHRVEMTVYIGLQLACLSAPRKGLS